MVILFLFFLLFFCLFSMYYFSVNNLFIYLLFCLFASLFLVCVCVLLHFCNFDHFVLSFSSDIKKDRKKNILFVHLLCACLLIIYFIDYLCVVYSLFLIHPYVSFIFIFLFFNIYIYFSFVLFLSFIVYDVWCIFCLCLILIFFVLFHLF